MFGTDRITISEFNKKSSFKEPHRCNHFIMVFCTQGEVTIELNYTQYTLRKNGILTINPLDIITLKDGSDDFLAQVLVIPTRLPTIIMKDYSINVLEYMKSNPVCYYDEPCLRIVYHVFDIILEAKEIFEYEAFENIVMKEVAVLSSIRHQHCSTLCNETKVHHEFLSRKKDLFRRFVKELISSHSVSREVLFYANELNVSCGYLNEVCNEVSGHSAKEIIDSAVVTTLKYELSYSTKSIQELADEYNFPSQSYFSRYYKRLTGTTPTEFRKNRGGA